MEHLFLPVEVPVQVEVIFLFRVQVVRVNHHEALAVDQVADEQLDVF